MSAAALFAELSRRAPPRRSVPPLPALRFVPGLAVEAGTTAVRPKDLPTTAVTPLDPAHWQHCATWLLGVDLYNHGFFWEAHEAWEQPWRSVPRRPAVAALLQGLIQVAAGHLKLLAGQDGVARALWRSGTAHVARAGAASGVPVWAGLRWEAWLANLAAYGMACGAGHQPERFPFLVLIET